ncbi:hypothetical protein FRC16_010137 [Serendipita sp. 398]|nr:hypothetical protein FRC16_010137 [Serendipita sp. 398]
MFDRMWSRAGTISDKDLTNFNISEDLVSVRAGPTTYGVILLGKIRLPKVPKITVGGRESDGFVHVRIHDPPNRGTEDVTFHSLWTDEGKRDENGRAEHYIAIQTDDVPLEFFNE